MHLGLACLPARLLACLLACLKACLLALSPPASASCAHTSARSLTDLPRWSAGSEITYLAAPGHSQRPS